MLTLVFSIAPATESGADDERWSALIALAIDLLRQKADERKALQDLEASRREYLVEKISSFCLQLDSIYQPIKKIRREIRLAVGYDFHGNVERQLYLETTAQLNDLQLSLEQLHTQIADLNRTSVLQESRTGEQLRLAEDELRSMRDYLDEVQTEAEWKARTFVGDAGGAEFPRLRGFVVGVQVPNSTADFRSVFVRHYKRAKTFLLQARMYADTERRLPVLP